MSAESDEVINAVTKWTAGKAALQYDDLRLVMRAFMHLMRKSDVVKAVKPWDKCDCGFDKVLIDDIISLVPDRDLGVAVMRLVVFSELPEHKLRDEFFVLFPVAAKLYNQTSLLDMGVTP